MRVPGSFPELNGNFRHTRMGRTKTKVTSHCLHIDQRAGDAQSSPNVDMKLIDNRDSTKSSGLALAGGFYYTSGKVLKLVLPAAILNLSSIGIGFAL
mmetsp:Transcript_5920/g.8621  ORF Transcript_5920/g.8621 Transcript_5920/m.8621 type:complete len:97 (+) Transcript_5920:707-997(+)